MKSGRFRQVINTRTIMYDWLRKVLSSRGTESRRGESVSPELKSDTIFVPDDDEEAPASQDEEKLSGAGISRDRRVELNAKYCAWLFRRQDAPSVFTAVAETEILHTLDELLKSSHSSTHLVRRMPGIIPQLLQSLRTENFSGAQLAKTISHDIAMVGEVIRLANGAYYNPTQPVASIESAILILGHDGLRQLVTGVAFRPIIDMKSGYFTRLLAQRVWDQSEKCAVACRTLSRMEKVSSFDGFLVGLIQYVGLIASLRMMDQIPREEADVGTLRFYDSLVEMTRPVSCSIAREWHFPDAVTGAIEEQGLSGRNAAMSLLGKILATGDYLGKLSILLEEGVMTRDDAIVLELSQHELECLDQLVEVKEQE